MNMKCWSFGDRPLRQVILSCVNCGTPSTYTGLRTDVLICAACYRDGFRAGKNDRPKFFRCVATNTGGKPTIPSELEWLQVHMVQAQNYIEQLRSEICSAVARPVLIGRTTERPEAYLWWGDGDDAVTWYVQIHCAQAVVDAVEAALRALGGVIR